MLDFTAKPAMLLIRKGKCMKILIATKEKQTCSRDFYWTKGDEVVKFPTMECDNGCTCGCTRAWVGTQSSKSTTTAKVIESPITINGLAKVIYDSMVKDGWVNERTPHNLKQGVMKQCKADAKELSKIASRRKVGTIIRREGARVFDA